MAGKVSSYIHTQATYSVLLFVYVAVYSASIYIKYFDTKDGSLNFLRSGLGYTHVDGTDSFIFDTVCNTSHCLKQTTTWPDKIIRQIEVRQGTECSV